jgi:hypothetical protein
MQVLDDAGASPQMICGEVRDLLFFGLPSAKALGYFLASLCDARLIAARKLRWA